MNHSVDALYKVDRGLPTSGQFKLLDLSTEKLASPTFAFLNVKKSIVRGPAQ